MPDPSIPALLSEALSSIRDPNRRRVARDRLIEPEVRELDWGYGPKPLQFEIWIVARAEDGREIAYTRVGFGLVNPWGVLSPGSRSLGRDDQWFHSLEDALIAVRAFDAPTGYEVP